MRLLIIDDSENIRSTLIKFLPEFTGITSVSEADDIDSGILSICKAPPDIILLDIMLKSGTAFDFLRNTKEQRGDATVILYSNFLDEEYIAAAKKYGISYFFNKSDDIFRLISLINQITTQ